MKWRKINFYSVLLLLFFGGIILPEDIAGQTTCDNIMPAIPCNFSIDAIMNNVCSDNIDPSGSITVELNDPNVTGTEFQAHLTWGGTNSVTVGFNADRVAVFSQLPDRDDYDIEVTRLMPSCSCETVNSITIGTFVPGFTTTITHDKGVTCKGDSDGIATVVVEDGSGDFGYLWSPSGETTEQATALPAGYNFVMITDRQTGCKKRDSVEIEEPNFSLVATMIGIKDNLNCAGDTDGVLDVNASGGWPGNYTYLWSNGETNDTISQLPTGSYSVTVTDNLGCQVVDSIEVSSPDPILPMVGVFPATCFRSSNGAISLDPSGGVPPYIYTWTVPGTSNNISNLAAGDYSATITDMNGCTQVVDTVVTQPDSLVTQASVINHVSCTGNQSGSAEVATSGGNGGNTSIWSDQQTGDAVTNLAPGTYSVTTTDSKGCSDTSSVTIIKESNPEITQYETSVILNEGEISSVNFDVNPASSALFWNIKSTLNIDTTDPYAPSGSTSDNVIQQSYALENSRSSGELCMNVYPVNGECIGDTVSIIIDVIPKIDGDLFIPDLFTPNGDGTNDTWEVQFPSHLDPGDYSVVIYNRAGGKVYESATMLEQWQGQNCPDGVYFYRISSSVSNEQYSGAITILRRMN